MGRPAPIQKAWFRHHNIRDAFRSGVCLSLAASLLAIHTTFAQSTNLPPGASGFGTGGGQPLQRSNLSFLVPTNLPSLSLSFDVGFGTDEVVVSGEFYDSFSATLRNSNRTFTASLLTADLFGVTWAPTDTSGNSLTNTLLFEPGQFPTLPHTFAVRFGYRAAVEIPSFMFGQSGTVAISLFDNLDPEASVGFVQNVRLAPSLSAPLALESSALANGPFAEEIGIQINRVRQTITLPGGGMARFYRLRWDGSSRITQFRGAGSEFIFQYSNSPPNVSLLLERSPTVSGPYLVVPEARFDISNRVVRVDRSLTSAFFRLRGNVLATITGARVEGADLVLSFQYPEPVPLLESSAQVQGPYAPEHGVVSDLVAKRLQVGRTGQARFYRVRSDTLLVIRRLERAGNDLIFHYDLP